MIEQNKALVRRWYDEVWNKGRSELIAEMFGEDTIAHGLTDESGSPIRGVEGFTTFQAKFRTAFPDLKITVEGEPPGDWVIEANGAIVASGAFLCHYNPPYADLFMEVTKSVRRQGFGGFLLQEVKRVCYEAGKKSAARCNPSNIASRKTLGKAGFVPCVRLLVGNVR